MDKYEDAVMRDTCTVMQLLALLVKTLFRHGNCRVITSSLQRTEALMLDEGYYDKRLRALYIPGT